MKQNREYVLHEISGVSYLLPYGQNVAEQKKSVQLNATGVFIWNTLAKEPSRQELLGAMAEHFSIASEDLFQLEQDLDEFLRPLIFMGIVEPDKSAYPAPAASFSTYLEIGGLLLHFQGPEALLASQFLPFVVTDSHAESHQTIVITAGLPVHYSQNKLLIMNRELTLWDAGSYYVFHFPSLSGIAECHMSKDSKHCTFYCIPPFEEKLAQNLFHAIRFVYLAAAQRYGRFMLHSASLLYRDKAWLFSGSSGTGKSTHTNLWKEQFGTPLLNGDLNLMEITSQGAVIHGTPWCGTSGIFTTESYPLGGIVLLKQALQDSCETMSQDKKILSVMQRLISPSWTADMLQWNLKFTERLVEQIPVFRLWCTPNPSAALTMRSQIDAYYNNCTFQ